ncbi:CGNR zinc finger domain-containing protein [Marinomonas spartinae]|uniref:CGNR zinc finger domain-containing protein n=1 Tax=Marinomonas spartinae TaxID=1792290 RepID=UPI001F356DFA|nr:CGNR zinc finger domain-containing protein [Marinomonas spartinae]
MNVDIDSYEFTGIRISLSFVNQLLPGKLQGNEFKGKVDFSTLTDILSEDPGSLQRLEENHVEEFVSLAKVLREIIVLLGKGEVSTSAQKLNALMSECPATPSLECDENGHWHLHHHPLDAGLIAMWTAICAEGLARMVGEQHYHRFGVCEAVECDRVFFDTSRNGRRRFCSVSCQNRTKIAAFRLRNSKNK